MFNMFAEKKPCFFRIHTIIPVISLLCCCFPGESNADDRKDISNSEKIKIINQALRTQLQEKKLDLKAENIFQQIGKKIPLGNPDGIDSGASQQNEEAEKQKFEKEMLKRYPAYLPGDILKISGDSGTITGRYNKRTRRGITIGNRLIPWSDLDPECAALFQYKSLIELRSKRFQDHFNRLYRKDKIKIDGAWISTREYISQRVQNCVEMIKDKSRINDLVQVMIYVLCSILAGGIAGAIGKFKKGTISMIFGGITGILIGIFIGSQVINILKTQKIDKAVASVLETIVDTKDKEVKAAEKFKFNKVEELQTFRSMKK